MVTGYTLEDCKLKFLFQLQVIVSGIRFIIYTKWTHINDIEFNFTIVLVISFLLKYIKSLPKYVRIYTLNLWSIPVELLTLLYMYLMVICRYGHKRLTAHVNIFTVFCLHWILWISSSINLKDHTRLNYNLRVLCRDISRVDNWL